jgi:hypothetical protein
MSKLRVPPLNEVPTAVLVLETVIVVERETPARLAVMTTGEAEAAPSVTETTAWRGGYPVAGTVAGTGTAVGFELVRLTTYGPLASSTLSTTRIWIDFPVRPYG